MEFFSAGVDYRERLMLAANRVGKTEGVGGYEVALHLTGLYPDWWTGRRFNKPVKIWAAGDTSVTVRDIIQAKLLGPKDDMGTGLIPADKIKKTTPKSGVPDAVESIYVEHVSGKTSILSLKTYEQGRKSFQGTEQDVIWLDEECPLDIYSECLIRTMTTKGMILCTFTPLSGLTEMVLSFLPGGKLPDDKNTEKSSKFCVMATWDDVPHLSKEDKDELFESIPPYQRDARSKGVPQLGSGAIYPIPESEIVVDPFDIPHYWPRFYGMDVGWNRTAVVWGAIDRESGVVYLYSEYYKGAAEPSVHADGIRSRGEWIPGAIDPASRGRAQKDGEQLFQLYLDQGLRIEKADNGVESGLYDVWQMLSSGRLKVFSHLHSWLAEYRIYRRDEKGKVVKENDHLMDATRYGVKTGIDLAIVQPEEDHEDYDYADSTRSAIGGY